MQLEELNANLGPLFGLKFVFFNTFDSSSLAHNLNKTQERVLMMTWHHTKASMVFLSREAGLEKGSLTSIIDSLEKLNLVRRERDQDDHRSFCVIPTSAGECLAKQINALFCAHLDRMLGNLTENERQEFEKATQTLAALIPHLAHCY